MHTHDTNRAFRFIFFTFSRKRVRNPQQKSVQETNITFYLLDVVGIFSVNSTLLNEI